MRGVSLKELSGTAVHASRPGPALSFGCHVGVKLTVAICTWNRCVRLESTLATLSSTAIPDGVNWDVVVVNNNCTDATDEVIRSFGGRLPVRSVFEPVPGVANARNAAVRHASGDYVFWLDDDVLVPPGWMTAYVDAIGRHPDAAVFGGPITPHFEAEPPSWLADNLRSIPEPFGVLDPGPVERPIDHATNYLPFGANCVVRRAELLRFPYDPSIGRSPTEAFLGGEETGVMKSILASGETGWWVPIATVAHRVRPEQLNLDYVERFYTGIGRWMGLSDRSQRFPTLLGYPRWMLLEFAIREFKYQVGRPFTPRTSRLTSMKARRILMGRLLSARSSR